MEKLTDTVLRVSWVGSGAGLTAGLGIYLLRSVLSKTIYDRAMRTATNFTLFFIAISFVVVAITVVQLAVHGRTPRQMTSATSRAIGKTVLYIFAPCAAVTAAMVLWLALTHQL